jgi:hypothetical protein
MSVMSVMSVRSLRRGGYCVLDQANPIRFLS